MAVRKEVSHLCRLQEFILVFSILHMEMGDNGADKRHTSKQNKMIV